MLDWLEKLKPKFDDVDPKQVSLSESIKELESLEQDVKNLNRKVLFTFYASYLYTYSLIYSLIIR